MRGVLGGVAATLAVAACDGAVEGDRVDAILALEGDPAAGQVQFETLCVTCHGVEAVGGTGPALAGYDDPEEFVGVVLGGKGSMGSFESLLDQDIADILAYLQSL